MELILDTSYRPSFQISTAKKVLGHYDAYLIDLWGVIHDGFHPYPGVVDCLNRLILQNKSLIFISNAPRPSHVMMKKLIDFGIAIKPEMMLTSGDVVRHQLTHYEDAHFRGVGKCIYHLGADRNPDILEGLDVDLALNIEQADFILLTAYLDEDEDLNQLDARLQQAVNRNIPMLCANPDKIILNGNKRRHCSGVFAEKYEKMGGIVHYYGKPHKAILDAALTTLQKKGIQDRDRILMIGDTLETDIQAAQKMGTHSALVLTGNTGIMLDENKEIPTPKFLENLFQRTGINPNWVIPSLSE